MADQPNNPDTEETVNILDREGAIRVLRAIRQDIQAVDALGTMAKLAPPDQQIARLQQLASMLGGQLYAITMILSRSLDDPEIEAEFEADTEEGE